MYLSPLCMCNEAVYLSGLKEAATAALLRGSPSAGSDKVPPKPDRRAIRCHNSSPQNTCIFEHIGELKELGN